MSVLDNPQDLLGICDIAVSLDVRQKAVIEANANDIGHRL